MKDKHKTKVQLIEELAEMRARIAELEDLQQQKRPVQPDELLIQVGGCRTAFTEVTGGKQAEEALRQAEKRYRNLFENAIEGIFQTTPDGRIVLANPCFVRMYGYSSLEEMISSVYFN